MARRTMDDQEPQAAADTLPSSGDGGLTIYYDGACPLCEAEMALYSRQDRAGVLRLIDVAASATVLPADLSRQAALARFHVRRPDGTLESGAAAFALLWRSLPAWRSVGRLAQRPSAHWVLEAAYRLFLPIRPTLSWLVRRLSRR